MIHDDQIPPEPPVGTTLLWRCPDGSVGSATHLESYWEGWSDYSADPWPDVARFVFTQAVGPVRAIRTDYLLDHVEAWDLHLIAFTTIELRPHVEPADKKCPRARRNSDKREPHEPHEWVAGVDLSVGEIDGFPARCPGWVEPDPRPDPPAAVLDRYGDKWTRQKDGLYGYFPLHDLARRYGPLTVPVPLDPAGYRGGPVVSRDAPGGAG